MKRIALLSLLLVSFASAAFAQAVPSPIWVYNWPFVTATGVVGQYLSVAAPNAGGPSASYTIQAYVTGTLPTTCTFEVQSSPDGVVWETGSDTLSGDVSCASATTKTYSFTSKPVRFVRVNLGTLTGGDATTKVYFFYTRANNAK